MLEVKNPMQMRRLFKLFTLVTYLGLGCQRAEESNLNNQTKLTQASSILQLWASKSIKVCIKDINQAPSYLEELKNHVKAQFSQLGFDFYSWKACSENELNYANQLETKTLALLHISFDKLPSRIGGTAPIGAAMGIFSVVSIKADPENHISEECNTDIEKQKICMKRWMLHEIAHTMGLTHSHNHPDIYQDFYDSMPITKNNASDEWSYHNYIGSLSKDSIMNYKTPDTVTELSSSDVASLRTLYDEPVVLISSSRDNGDEVDKLELKLFSPHLETKRSDDIIASHFRYALMKAKEGGNCEQLEVENYSEAIAINQAVNLDFKALGFKDKDPINICVLGEKRAGQVLRQSLATNIFVIASKKAEYNFSGQAFTGDCSATIVKRPGAMKSDKALILTNAHCVYGIMEAQAKNRVFTDFSVSLLKVDGKVSSTKLNSVKLIFYSTIETDIALIESDQTIEWLESQGFEALPLGSKAVVVDQVVEVMPGLFSRGFTCKLAAKVSELREGGKSFFHVVRYGKNCGLGPGSSGSAMIDKNTREVVGVTFTGNDNGLKCLQNNPCEIEGDRIIYEKSYAYALSFSNVWEDLISLN